MVRAAAPCSRVSWAPESCHLPALQLPPEGGGSLWAPEVASGAEGDPQKLEAWIEERKQLRSQLESVADVEKWLMRKPSLSGQEERVWGRIKACRADRRAESKSAVTHSLGSSPPGSCQPWQGGHPPLTRAPYPLALITLHNLLRKQKLTMADVFKRAGMDRRKITRADFICVIKATKVPISNKDLETLIIFLASSVRGDFISKNDLVECQRQWLEMMKGQSRETRTGVQAQFHKTTCTTASCVTSAGGKAQEMKPRAPAKPETQLMLLEVPPVTTEPEHRYLSYDEMEETGRQFRGRRQWKKNKDSPLERKEECHLVRSEGAAVDEHCLPSTAEGDVGALVDRYRRDCFVSYRKSLKLCREHNSGLTELMLQKALLHPGDKIIKEGEDTRQTRQPGGSYTSARDPAPSPASTSRSRTVSRKQAREVENRKFQRNKMQMKLVHVSKSNDNNFWPGHLLDGLRLYLPEVEPGGAQALFSCVCAAKAPPQLTGQGGGSAYGDAAFERPAAAGAVLAAVRQGSAASCSVSQLPGPGPRSGGEQSYRTVSPGYRCRGGTGTKYTSQPGAALLLP
ncbi:EF-hand calcium-binding domain-containing protein 12 isoform X2 [Balearica regulorum gibbericeps]